MGALRGGTIRQMENKLTGTDFQPGFGYSTVEDSQLILPAEESDAGTRLEVSGIDGCMAASQIQFL